MLQEFEDKIVFMLLPNIEASKLGPGTGCEAKEVSFQQFVEGYCGDFIETDVKENVPAFIPGSFKDPSEWITNDKGSERIWQNMGKVSLLGLDFDDSITINGKKTIDNAREVFKDHEYFIHSTHSRTKQNPDKYRMLIKLEHPIAVEEWKAFVHKIIAPLGADSSCSNPSRGFYFPSCIDRNNPENASKFIEPYSEYHPGRALTLEFVDQIAKDYQNFLRKAGRSDDLKNYLWKTSEKTQIEGKRHPAGGIVKDNVVHSQVDTSYESYVKRHMPSIKEHLVDGRRHNFALSAIMREFQIYRDMVDVSSLVMFLYKAAEDYSDSYLYMEGSPTEDRKTHTKPEDFFALKNQRSRRDTPEELEEMIASAIRSTSNMTKPASRFVSRLDAAKKSAEVASQTNNWVFRKPKRPNKEAEKKDELSEVMDNLSDVISSFNLRNWNEFVHSMLGDVVNDKEMDSSKRATEIRYRCQAIMKTVDDFYAANSDKLKRGINTEAFNKELISVASKIAGKDKALKMSILTGFESYKKHMTQLEPKTGKSPHP